MILKKLLSLLAAFALLAVPARAQVTVNYNSVWFFGATNNRAVTIKLRSAGQIFSGPNSTNIPCTITPSNGTFSVTLQPLTYLVSIDGISKVFTMPISVTNGTINMIDPINAGVTMDAPIPSIAAGTNVAIATNYVAGQPVYSISATNGSGSGSGFPLNSNVSGGGNTISNAFFKGDGSGLTNLSTNGLPGALAALANSNGVSITNISTNGLPGALASLANSNGIRLTNLIGTNIHAIFVSPNGNDATAVRGDINHPFKSWYDWDGDVTTTGITQIATNGDTIYVLPGTYAVSWIPLNPGVSLIGIGNPTIIRSNVNITGFPSTADLNNMGPFIQPNTNCLIQGINFIATNGSFDAPVGTWEAVDTYDNYGLPQVGSATGWFFSNCSFSGSSDSLYVVINTGSTNRGTFQNCQFISGEDATRVDKAGVDITFIDCFYSGIFGFAPGQSGYARIFVPTSGAALRDIGGVGTFYATNNTNTGGAFASAGAMVILQGTKFFPQTNQTSNYIAFTNDATGVVTGDYYTEKTNRHIGYNGTGLNFTNGVGTFNGPFTFTSSLSSTATNDLSAQFTTTGITNTNAYEIVLIGITGTTGNFKAKGGQTYSLGTITVPSTFVLQVGDAITFVSGGAKAGIKPL